MRWWGWGGRGSWIHTISLKPLSECWHLGEAEQLIFRTKNNNPLNSDFDRHQYIQIWEESAHHKILDIKKWGLLFQGKRGHVKHKKMWFITTFQSKHSLSEWRKLIIWLIFNWQTHWRLCLCSPSLLWASWWLTVWFNSVGVGQLLGISTNLHVCMCYKHCLSLEISKSFFIPEDKKSAVWGSFQTEHVEKFHGVERKKAKTHPHCVQLFLNADPEGFTEHPR